MAELVEGARLEIVYTPNRVSRVRIPLSPPEIKGLQEFANPFYMLIFLLKSLFAKNLLKNDLRQNRIEKDKLKSFVANLNPKFLYHLFK